MSEDIRKMIDKVKSFNQFIKTTIREFLSENKTYDELISLEKWYDEEKKNYI